MSEEIMTCPQCGATVQAPARFCVTCGIKLPDSMATHDDSGPVDPRAGWTTRDTSGWTTPPPGAFDFEDPTIIDVEPIPVTPEPPVSRWASWPSQPERAEETTPPPPIPVDDADDYVVQASVVPPVEEAEIAEPDETAEIEVETMAQNWTQSSDAAQPVAETRVEDEPLTEEITPAFEEPEPLLAEVATEPTELTESVNVLIDDADEDDEGESGDDFEAAGWIEEEPAPEPAVAAYEPEPLQEIENDDMDDPEDPFFENELPAVTSEGIERANQLLDELRALLPMLAGSPDQELAFSEPPIAVVETPSIDLTEIKAAAVEARGEISFDNFSALRTTIDEATNKPRDVEVMLKLSQRVEDIVALLAERDRLQVAFDDMLSRLNS